MKTRIHDLFLLPVLMAALGLMPAGRVVAQNITNLHSFAGYPDGKLPLGGLMIAGSTLYGTTQQGGTNTSGYGMVFAVNTDGSGYTNLHSFNNGNNDGAYPLGQLILSGNKLYGTAANGGSNGAGTLFYVYTNGLGFTNFYKFTGSITNGIAPYFGGLILSGNTLYGTTYQGGSNNNGTVFAVNTDGSGYTNLHSFSGSPIDGSAPQSGLILSGSTLYGTTKSGGTNSDNGTVFAVNTNGSGFTTLHYFHGSSDGATPFCQLVLSGNTLYGAASGGTTNFDGMVFGINTDGSGYTNLYTFSALSNNTNSDGAGPQSLILSGSTLYGVTYQGGANGNGTVFAVSTNGSGFTNLYNFSPLISNTNAYGATPYDRSGLIFSGNTLYGTASQGGANGNGTVFALILPSVVSPVLTNIIVSPASPTIGVGSNQQFTATGYYNDGSSQTLTNGSGGTNLLWSSFPTNVASITTNGVATGLTNGVTTITATSGSVNGFALLTVVSPPAISLQPTNNTVSPNGSVTLNVGATGGVLSYQWQFDGTNISGATGATLTIPNVTSTNVGVYSVIVSNLAGTVTSQAAIVGTTDCKMFAGVIVDGPLGSNYLIQARPNLLSNWTTLTNIALPSQPYIYIDYNSVTNKQQFYIAVPQ